MMIYDCFLFFNEFELLEVRLNTLSEYVDKFVLIESGHTFQGQEKPLWYRVNQSQFDRFANRIIHVNVDLGTTLNDRSYQGGWDREHATRMAIARVLADRPRDDIVLLSDIDEIPDLRGWSPEDVPCVWWHRLFYYYVNLECCQSDGRSCRWKGTVAAPLGTFFEDPKIQGDGQKFRDWRHYDVRRVIEDTCGGWHFSYLGGTQRIIEKINAFAHAELLSHATPENVDRAITEGWKEGIDLFNRKLYQFAVILDDSGLPPYLTANKERFRHLWK